MRRMKNDSRRAQRRCVGALAAILMMAAPFPIGIFPIGTVPAGAGSDGEIDKRFGIGGRVVTPFASGPSLARSVAVHADGTIVAAGAVFTPAGPDFAVARYLANGTLDTSFGGTGTVTVDFGGSVDDGWPVAVQADGKIIAGGLVAVSGSIDFGLVRFNVDGSLDTSFGGDGTVTTAFLPGTTDALIDLAVQPDGKIVAVGNVNRGFGTANFALARYHADGSLDATFGVNGLVITDVSTPSAPRSDAAQAVVLQPDGKIVVGGISFTGTVTNQDFAFARYHADGTLDTTFGVNGTASVDIFRGLTLLQDIDLQSDGKIIAAGGIRLGPFEAHGVVTRLLADGSLDVSFGMGGTITTPAIGPIPDITVRPDGKLLAVSAAFSQHERSSDFAVARYLADGSLDPSFGFGTGIIRTDFTASEHAAAVAVQTNGRIVAAGSVSLPDGSGHFALARYLSTP